MDAEHTWRRERTNDMGAHRPVVRAKQFSAIALLVAAAAACGTDPMAQFQESVGTAGRACNASGDCRPGLSCETLGDPASARCAEASQFCTVSCTSNADCASLGSRFTCQRTCGDRAVCFD